MKFCPHLIHVRRHSRFMVLRIMLCPSGSFPCLHRPSLHQGAPLTNSIQSRMVSCACRRCPAMELHLAILLRHLTASAVVLNCWSGEHETGMSVSWLMGLECSCGLEDNSVIVAAGRLPECAIRSCKNPPRNSSYSMMFDHLIRRQ